MPNNQLDMKTLTHLACWGSALRTMAEEISRPTPTGAALRGQDPMKIIGLTLQGAERLFAATPPEQLRTELLELAQKLSITLMEEEAPDADG